MARTRTVKPSFFRNEILAEIEPHGRLLFVSLWQQADRAGRLEDRPKRIRVESFPYEPQVDVDRLLSELARRGFIFRYEVDGARYIQVENFEKHQAVFHREPASTIPPPPEHRHVADFSTGGGNGEGDSEMLEHEQNTDQARLKHGLNTARDALSLESGVLSLDSGVLSPAKDQALSAFVPKTDGSLAFESSEKRAAAAKRREIDWRIDEVWSAHLAQFRGHFEDTTGKAPPGRAPTLTPDIRKDIRDALLTYDEELLGPESRERWLEESKARAAGVGMYLDPFLTGHSPDNDLRNGGKRYLEHWRPWRKQRGKGCPVERFSELYFEARLYAPRPTPVKRPIIVVEGGQGVLDGLAAG